MAKTWEFEGIESGPSSDDGFKVWYRKVDAAVSVKARCSVDDLADQPFRDWYEDGLSPKSAARRALQREGF